MGWMQDYRVRSTLTGSDARCDTGGGDRLAGPWHRAGWGEPEENRGWSLGWFDLLARFRPMVKGKWGKGFIFL
jgi:hypothetical protein